ncbi:MAG: 2-oxo acid dehydrogenase subunit E2 [Proteobacteria bacterium]|nr:2-oxo acid dehydrogenase subunit E2 [Pseudomonadota bacterium]
MSRYVFKLPDLGEGTVQAEIVAWHVKPGDVVAEEDVIVEVMTDKASVEVPSPISGRVLAVTGAPGDMVAVGAELISFETDAGAGDAAGAVTGSDAVATGSGAAALGGGGAASGAGVGTAAAGGSPARAAAGPSGAAASGASASRSASTPAASAANAVPSGASSAKPGAAAGQAAPPQAVAGNAAARSGAVASGAGSRAGGTSAASGSASRGGSASSAASHGAAALGAASHGTAAHGTAAHGAAGTVAGVRGTNGSGNGHARTVGRVATSPAIRRRAHEAGVDLTQLAGSGPNGRILREDFEAFVSSRSGPKLVRSRPELVSNQPETEEIKVIGIRRVIAQRMSEAKRNIPHFAYVEEIDVTELETLRRHLNSKLEKGSASLTYLPFIVSALTRVLRDFPQCNAQYDSERNVIIRHRSVHVGVATQTPEGLKVPVVHNAQSLGLWDLAEQMRRVTEAARTNKASRDELTGSTITVTSLGKLGGIASTPIINAPEVSIIGVNRAVERPMVVDGAITVRRMMNLSSSFDHRFVDGHDAAAMIQALKERIEHPATIFID